MKISKISKQEISQNNQLRRSEKNVKHEFFVELEKSHFGPLFAPKPQN